MIMPLMLMLVEFFGLLMVISRLQSQHGPCILIKTRVPHQAKRTTLIEDPQPSQTFTTKQLRLQPIERGVFGSPT